MLTESQQFFLIDGLDKPKSIYKNKTKQKTKQNKTKEQTNKQTKNYNKQTKPRLKSGKNIHDKCLFFEKMVMQKSQ